MKNIAITVCALGALVLAGCAKNNPPPAPAPMHHSVGNSKLGKLGRS